MYSYVQPRPGEGFGQRGDFGPVIGGGPAEPAGQRAVRSGVLPVFPAGRGGGAPRDGGDGRKPCHAVRSDAHGVAEGGGLAFHVAEDRGDALGRGEVGRGVVGAEREAFAPAAPAVEFEQRRFVGRLHEVNQHTHVGGNAFGHDTCHVLDVGAEVGGEVARPRHIHQVGLRGRLGRRVARFLLVGAGGRQGRDGKQDAEPAERAGHL